MSSSVPSHDMKGQIRALQLCLTADKRPLGFLLGAGCPLSIKVQRGGKEEELIPDIKKLTLQIRARLSAEPDHKAVLDSFDICCGEDGVAGATIEHCLNRLRSIYAVGGKSTVRGITPDQALNTDRRICALIKEAVDQTLPSTNSPYHALARWIRGIPRTAAVEVFTPNYDLLFEQSLEENGVPYFDGFAGVRRAFLDVEAMENDSPPQVLPARWARLWKLHGSVNWHRDKKGNVWRGTDSDDSDLLVYPSHDKFVQTRQMPFLAMMDRVKAFLSRPEAILIVCGYSFLDDHINAILRDGLRRNARLAVFGLVFGPLEKTHAAVPLAEHASNFLLLGRDAAVIGGRHGTWDAAGEFAQGDFASFGELLSSMTGQIDGRPMIHNATGADISRNR